TIYRILDFFLENRIVHKLESQNKYIGCSHPGEMHNCYFLICNKCNKVEEACNENILKAIYEKFEKKHFIVEHINLEIFGTCVNCSVC
ncbi:MAG: transcriptional repressor, partial [Pseudomonadota bacterium]